MKLPRLPREALMGKRDSALVENDIAPIKIEMLSANVKLEASSRAGNGNSPSRLRMRLSATQPGWTLGMVASDLVSQGKSPTVKISANEILARNGQNGTYNSLKEPIPLILNVPVRSQNIDIELMIASAGNNRRIDNYQGEVLLLASHSSGLKMPPVAVAINVDVTCRLKHIVRNDKLYFHFASLPDKVKGKVEGELSSEAPVILSLSAPQGKRADQIPATWLYQRPRGRTNSKTDPSIGVKWQLREGTDSKLRDPDDVSDNTISWRLRETPGDLRYALDCTVEPEATQAAGTYRAELVLKLTPQL